MVLKYILQHSIRTLADLMFIIQLILLKKDWYELDELFCRLSQSTTSPTGATTCHQAWHALAIRFVPSAPTSSLVF